MPSKDEAGRRLALIIRENKNSRVIKIIHGYGSTGVGGVIKSSVQKSLRKRIKNNEISAYIPGEAFSSLLGFDEVISEYRHLIKDDSDFKKSNPGITYVIFK